MVQKTYKRKVVFFFVLSFTRSIVLHSPTFLSHFHKLQSVSFQMANTPKQKSLLTIRMQPATDSSLPLIKAGSRYNESYNKNRTLISLSHSAPTVSLGRGGMWVSFLKNVIVGNRKRHMVLIFNCKTKMCELINRDHNVQKRLGEEESCVMVMNLETYIRMLGSTKRAGYIILYT